MTTAYVCSSCGRVTEMYEDPEPWVEVSDSPCTECLQEGRLFDEGFAAVEERAYADPFASRREQGS